MSVAMRHLAASFLFCLLAFLGLAAPAHAEFTPGNIFDTMGGTTTIDKGGSIHSQARSIYSLGGSMTSFQNRKVTLLAADGPSFGAGCSGISWHFGGFAFISVDEIRQLVESISQASLGVAVDLAMQTLCPQCYAVMAKLRDIANMMRNAAADSCKVAQTFGKLLQKEGLFSSAPRINNCSEIAGSKNTDTGILGSQFGNGMCSSLTAAEDYLKGAGDEVMNWYKGLGTSDGKPPTKDQIDSSGNLTYKALGSLGYQDGFIKDVLLSLMGMRIVFPKPAANCSESFAALQTSSASSAMVDVSQLTANNADAAARASAKNALISGGPAQPAVTVESMLADQNAGLEGGSPVEVTSTDPARQVSLGDVMVRAPSADPTGAQKGGMACDAPPLLPDAEIVAEKIICGFDAAQDSRTFRLKYGVDAPSLVAMCGELIKDHTAAAVDAQTVGSFSSQDARKPQMYHCDSSTSACMQPKTERMDVLMGMSTQNKQYSGLAWLALDALYQGVAAISANQPLPPETIAMLNGSDYPLYRVLNLAAVYPGMANDLLEAYGSVIAVHYAVDTLARMLKAGSNPALSVVPSAVDYNLVQSLRRDITNMVHGNDEFRDRALKRLAEKRALVATIVEVNKALQAEVISQGLGGNADMALSIKRQEQRTANTKP